MIKYSAFELLEHLKYGNRNISELDLKDNLIMILENISSIETDEIMLPEGGVDDDFLDDLMNDMDKFLDDVMVEKLTEPEIIKEIADINKELVNIQNKVNSQFGDYQRSTEEEIRKCNEILESLK